MTDLPKGWRDVALGEVTSIRSGKTPSQLEARLAENTRSDRDIPFYKVGDMNTSPKYLDDARVYLAQDELVTFGVSVITEGAIVFPKAGGAIATNKKRVMRTVGCIDLNCMAASASEGLSSSLLYYFFESTDLSTLTTGSILPQIGKKVVSELRIPLPPFAEQECIVEILEKQFSRLESALESIRIVREKVQAFRKSLLHAAFSGEFSSSESEYESKELQELVQSRADITDGPFGSNLKSAHYATSGPRVIRLANIGSGVFIDAHAHITNEHFQGLRKHQVNSGDVLVATLGEDIPRACLAPDFLGDAIVKADCIRIRPAPTVSSKYLSFAFNSPQVKTSVLDNVRGVTRPRINLGALRKTIIPIPNLEEQQRIVTILEEEFSRLDNALEVTNQLEVRIASERRSLLHAAFTGELTAKWRETHV